MNVLSPVSACRALSHTDSTVTYPIPALYPWIAQQGIRDAVRDIAPVNGKPCPACVRDITESFNALVRTGSGSDDSLASDMAALLGLEASEVTVNGWDDAPLESVTVPLSVSWNDALEAMHKAFRGEVPSGGYTWGVAYKWATLELTDRVCKECGHGK
ncbi:hypothetical protein [Rothia aeria]|uniref:hypothetical protein n=1 Tax=Rothia aeria TaxID=172042 RepID=UPI0028EA115E|nr:hypothetical protein [Rothia aeria]